MFKKIYMSRFLKLFLCASFMLLSLMITPFSPANAVGSTMWNEFQNVSRDKSYTFPFMILQGGATTQELQEYTGAMMDAGNQGVMVSSDLFAPEFLGTNWFNQITTILNKQNEYTGSSLIIQDNYNFPSFYDGNYSSVRIPEQYYAKMLNTVSTDVTGPATYNSTGWGDSNLIKILAGQTDANGYIVNDTTIDITSNLSGDTLTWNVPSGNWKIMKFYWRYDLQAGYTQHWLNGFSSDAVTWYCNNIVQPYITQYGANSNLKYWFYDEPKVSGDYETTIITDLNSRLVNTNKAMVAKLYTLASQDEAFENEWINAMTNVYGTTMIGQLRSFLNTNGIKLTGHAIDLVYNTAWYDYNKIISYQDIPGGDEIFSDVGGDDWYTRPNKITTTKQVSSVSHTTGKINEMAMLEEFAGRTDRYSAIEYGEMKLVTDYATVRGINFHVPCGIDPNWQSDEAVNSHRFYGGNPNGTYYKDYIKWTSYTNKLANLFNGGYHESPVAMIMPGYYKDADSVKYYDTMESIFSNLFDVDMVDRDALLSGTISNQRLNIYNEKYKIMLIPGFSSITKGSLQKVKDFYDNGGVVIAYNVIPSKSLLSDATDSEILTLANSIWGSSPTKGDTPRQTNANGGKSYYGDNLSVMLNNTGIQTSIKVMSGTTDNLKYLHRVKDGTDLFFMVNELNNSYTAKYRFTTIGSNLNPQVWDAEGGTCYSVNYTRIDANTVDITIPIGPHESKLVVFGGGGVATKLLTTPDSNTPTLSASYTYTLNGDTVQEAYDGIISYSGQSPKSRWTCYNSGNTSDWLQLEYPVSRLIDTVIIRLYNDFAGVRLPASYNVQYWNGTSWVDCTNQSKTPTIPGNRINTVKFKKVSTTKIRVVLTHQTGYYSGITEISAYDSGFGGNWRLNEGSGTSVSDSSGNANTGTLNGGAARTAVGGGKFGRGVSLDGVSGYVDIPDDSTLDGMSAFTVSMWVKIDQVGLNGSIILGKDSNPGNESYRITQLGYNSKLHFNIKTTNNGWYSAGTGVDSTTSLQNGIWYHVVATYDGSYVRLYINGNLEATGSQAISGNIYDGMSPLRLGYPVGGAAYTDGTIDEVRVYNRTLFPSEVADLYNSY